MIVSVTIAFGESADHLGAGEDVFGALRRRAIALLDDVAWAGCFAAEHSARLDHVVRACRTGAQAGLDLVAAPGCFPTHRFRAQEAVRRAFALIATLGRIAGTDRITAQGMLAVGIGAIDEPVVIVVQAVAAVLG
jgi:hypothetical protein